MRAIDMRTPNHDPKTPQPSMITVQKKLRSNVFTTDSHHHSTQEQNFAHAQVYTPYQLNKQHAFVDTKSQILVMLLGISLGLILSIAIGLNLEPKLLAYSLALILPFVMGYILKSVYVHTMQHLDDPD
jgi:hypothetical protein